MPKLKKKMIKTLEDEKPVVELGEDSKPEVTVDELTEELVSNCDQTSQRPRISPYTITPVVLNIGSEKTVHHVPRHMLPSGWSKTGLERRFNLSHLDTDTGHTLVHYLYTGAYETLDTEENSSTLEACIEFKRALRVYIMTSAYNLLELKRLAIQEMESHSAKLDVFELLGSVKDRFQELDPESWVHELLHKKVKTAFEDDHTMFENEGFLKNLDNTALNKFMMKVVVSSYNDKVSRMLSTERELSQKHDRDLINQNIIEEAVPEKNTEVQQDFIMPLSHETVIEECSERNFEYDEQCRAISCQSDDYLVLSTECPAEPEYCPTDDACLDNLCPGEQIYKPQSPVPDCSNEAATLEPMGKSPEEKSEDTEFTPDPVLESALEPEDMVDPFAGLSKSQKKKLQKKMKEDAKYATWSARQDIAFDPECMPVDLHNGQEDYFDQPIENDDGLCPFRATHLLEENMWKDCKSCRNVVQQMVCQAVRVTLGSEQFHASLEKLLIGK